MHDMFPRYQETLKKLDEDDAALTKVLAEQDSSSDARNTGIGRNGGGREIDKARRYK